MAYDGKLVMKWSKREGDIMIHFPRSVDGHYAHMMLTDPLKTFLDEMERRGYSRESFRLSIRKT